MFSLQITHTQVVSPAPKQSSPWLLLLVLLLSLSRGLLPDGREEVVLLEFCTGVTALSLSFTPEAASAALLLLRSLLHHTRRRFQKLSLSLPRFLSLSCPLLRVYHLLIRERKICTLSGCVFVSLALAICLCLPISLRGYLDLTQPRGPTDGRRSTPPLQNN